MERSAELKKYMLRVYYAMASGDAKFFRDALSKERGLLGIGSDPNEWWTSHPAVTKAFKAQLEMMGRFTSEGAAPVAYATGDFG